MKRNQTRALFLLSRHPNICFQDWHLHLKNWIKVISLHQGIFEQKFHFDFFFFENHLMGLDAHAVSLCFGHVAQQIPLVRSDRRGGGRPGMRIFSGIIVRGCSHIMSAASKF